MCLQGVRVSSSTIPSFLFVTKKTKFDQKKQFSSLDHYNPTWKTTVGLIEADCFSDLDDKCLMQLNVPPHPPFQHGLKCKPKMLELIATSPPPKNCTPWTDNGWTNYSFNPCLILQIHYLHTVNFSGRQCVPSLFVESPCQMKVMHFSVTISCLVIVALQFCQ